MINGSFSNGEQRTLWWDLLVTSCYQPKYEYSAEADYIHDFETHILPGNLTSLDKTYECTLESYKPSYTSSRAEGEEALTGFGYLNASDDWVDHEHGTINYDLEYFPTIDRSTAKCIRSTAEHLLEDIVWVKQYPKSDAEKNILYEEEYKRITAEWEQDFEEEYEQYKNHLNQRMCDIGFDHDGRFEDARITPAQFAMLAVGASNSGKHQSHTSRILVNTSSNYL